MSNVGFRNLNQLISVKKELNMCDFGARSLCPRAGYVIKLGTGSSRRRWWRTPAEDLHCGINSIMEYMRINQDTVTQFPPWGLITES